MQVLVKPRNIRSPIEKSEILERIFDDSGLDVTPKPLIYTPMRIRRRTSVKSRQDESETESASKLGLPKKTSKDGISFPQRIQDGDDTKEKDYLKELEIVKENLKSTKLEMEEATVKPASVVLYLEESQHFWHLHMPSTNYIASEDVQCQTDEIAPPSHQYRMSTAIQTYDPVSKKKMSQTAPIQMSTSCVFASEWDLYDTYRRLSYEDEEAELDSDDLDVDDLLSNQRPSLTSESTVSQINEVQPAKISRRANFQANKVMRLPEFQYATAVAERLLASNTFHNEQIAFMGSKLNTQDITTGFHYIMNELWTFSFEVSYNRIVNTVSWNTVNVNIVAVGYGYTRGSNLKDGLVCCWSVKNPSQPERVFPMKSPVMALSFSRTKPNLLAAGCYNGAVIILNISSKNGDKMVVNGEEGCLRYGPVGSLKWFMHTDFVVETEEIISVSKNGSVYKWNFTESFRSYEIMKLSYFQPNMKVAALRHQKDKTAPKNRLKYLNGLSVSLHPKEKMVYYVGTQEGCVVKCCINQQDRFVDIFPAHAGPIYGIVHSPFCSKIFCTYGADCYICLWVEDVKEPLLKLYYTKQPVLGVTWSPIHSTILASISGPYLSMWDLARKIIIPMSAVKSASGNLFTCVQFSTTGNNILTGDVTGDLSVFNLVDMPYPPFLQEEALIRALENALVTQPTHLALLQSALKIK